ncbi:hypothetical protein [Pararhodobacter zhoushanensis]|uniref:hypothetical protein n=1 Tax=Pararhodobacter zhoushanensis TaxID=2479545 RepID=UPI000F8EB03D|nr:hypothetical protein [Pararhodobacter zhoushanensis]
MTNPPPGWEDILAPDEHILWQDRPQTGIVWSDLISPVSIMGVFFTGFSIFWVTLAASMVPAGDPVFRLFPLFGLPFIAVGLYLLVGRLFWDAYVRQRTWYTLTNRKAYIATDVLFGRSLKPFDLREMNSLALDDSAPGTVWFHSQAYTRRSFRTASGGRSGGSRRQTTVVRTGFRRIPDARRVYRLITDAREAVMA